MQLISEIKKTDEIELEQVTEAKEKMKEILEENLNQPFSEEELSSLCLVYKMYNPRVLWKAWKALVSENKDEETYISDIPGFGKLRPKIFNQEVFINGKSVLKIGLYLPCG